MQKKNNSSKVTALTLTTAAAAVAATPVHADEQQFTDVSDQYFSYDAIQYLSANGIINGYEDGEFKPSEQLSREQTAALLARALELTPTSTDNPFQDVSDQGRFYKEVLATYDHGIFLGDHEGNFHPSDTITRQELASVLARTFQLSNNNTTVEEMSDHEDIASSHRQDVMALYAKGIIRGYGDDTFRPDEPVNRGQFAAFLSRSLNTTDTMKAVQRVHNDRLLINGTEYKLAEELKPLLQNEALLKSSQFKFETTGDTITAINELYITDDFTSEEPMTVSGHVRVNPSVTRLENVTVEGDLFVGEDAETVELMNAEPSTQTTFVKVDVEGDTTLDLPSSQTLAVYDSDWKQTTFASNNGSLSIEEGTSIQSLDVTTSSKVTKSDEASLESLQVSGKVSNLSLDGNFPSVEVNTDQSLNLLGEADITTLTQKGSSVLNVSLEGDIENLHFDSASALQVGEDTSVGELTTKEGLDLTELEESQEEWIEGVEASDSLDLEEVDSSDSEEDAGDSDSNTSSGGSSGSGNSDSDDDDTDSDDDLDDSEDTDSPDPEEPEATVDAVDNLSATADYRELTFTWDASTEEFFDRYEIYINKGDNTSKNDENATLETIEDIDTTTYLAEDLDADEYTAAVYVVDADGNYSEAAVVTETPGNTLEVSTNPFEDNITIESDILVNISAGETYGAATPGNNAIINGDVTLKGDISGEAATIQNVDINGTLTLDPGDNGSVDVTNVNADEIIVASGAEATTTFANVSSNNTTVTDSNGTRILSNGGNNLTTVTLDPSSPSDETETIFEGDLSNTSIAAKKPTTITANQGFTARDINVESADASSPVKLQSGNGNFSGIGTVVLSGSGSVEADENAAVEKVEVKSDGSSEVTIEGDGFKEAEVDVSGDSTLTVNGAVGKVKTSGNLKLGGSAADQIGTVEAEEGTTVTAADEETQTKLDSVKSNRISLAIDKIKSLPTPVTYENLADIEEARNAVNTAKSFGATDVDFVEGETDYLEALTAAEFSLAEVIEAIETAEDNLRNIPADASFIDYEEISLVQGYIDVIREAKATLDENDVPFENVNRSERLQAAEDRIVALQTAFTTAEDEWEAAFAKLPTDVTFATFNDDYPVFKEVKSALYEAIQAGVDVSGEQDAIDTTQAKMIQLLNQHAAYNDLAEALESYELPEVLTTENVKEAENSQESLQNLVAEALETGLTQQELPNTEKLDQLTTMIETFQEDLATAQEAFRTALDTINEVEEPTLEDYTTVQEALSAYDEAIEQLEALGEEVEEGLEQSKKLRSFIDEVEKDREELIESINKNLESVDAIDTPVEYGEYEEAKTLVSKLNQSLEIAEQQGLAEDDYESTESLEALADAVTTYETKRDTALEQLDQDFPEVTYANLAEIKSQLDQAAEFVSQLESINYPLQDEAAYVVFQTANGDYDEKFEAQKTAKDEAEEALRTFTFPAEDEDILDFYENNQESVDALEVAIQGALEKAIAKADVAGYERYTAMKERYEAATKTQKEILNDYEGAMAALMDTGVTYANLDQAQEMIDLVNEKVSVATKAGIDTSELDRYDQIDIHQSKVDEYLETQQAKLTEIEDAIAELPALDEISEENAFDIQASITSIQEKIANLSGYALSKSDVENAHKLQQVTFKLDTLIEDPTERINEASQLLAEFYEMNSIYASDVLNVHLHLELAKRAGATLDDFNEDHLDRFNQLSDWKEDILSESFDRLIDTRYQEGLDLLNNGEEITIDLLQDVTNYYLYPELEDKYVQVFNDMYDDFHPFTLENANAIVQSIHDVEEPRMLKKINDLLKNDPNQVTLDQLDFVHGGVHEDNLEEYLELLVEKRSNGPLSNHDFYLVTEELEEKMLNTQLEQSSLTLEKLQEYLYAPVFSGLMPEYLAKAEELNEEGRLNLEDFGEEVEKINAGNEALILQSINEMVPYFDYSVINYLEEHYTGELNYSLTEVRAKLVQEIIENGEITKERLEQGIFEGAAVRELEAIRQNPQQVNLTDLDALFDLYYWPKGAIDELRAGLIDLVEKGSLTDEAARSLYQDIEGRTWKMTLEEINSGKPAFGSLYQMDSDFRYDLYPSYLQAFEEYGPFDSLADAIEVMNQVGTADLISRIGEDIDSVGYVELREIRHFPEEQVEFVLEELNEAAQTEDLTVDRISEIIDQADSEYKGYLAEEILKDLTQLNADTMDRLEAHYEEVYEPFYPSYVEAELEEDEEHDHTSLNAAISSATRTIAEDRLLDQGTPLRIEDVRYGAEYEYGQREFLLPYYQQAVNEVFEEKDEPNLEDMSIALDEVYESGESLALKHLGENPATFDWDIFDQFFRDVPFISTAEDQYRDALVGVEELTKDKLNELFTGITQEYLIHDLNNNPITEDMIYDLRDVYPALYDYSAQDEYYEELSRQKSDGEITLEFMESLFINVALENLIQRDHLEHEIGEIIGHEQTLDEYDEAYRELLGANKEDISNYQDLEAVLLTPYQEVSNQFVTSINDNIDSLTQDLLNTGSNLEGIGETWNSIVEERVLLLERFRSQKNDNLTLEDIREAYDYDELDAKQDILPIIQEQWLNTDEILLEIYQRVAVDSHFDYDAASFMKEIMMQEEQGTLTDQELHTKFENAENVLKEQYTAIINEKLADTNQTIEFRELSFIPMSQQLQPELFDRYVQKLEVEFEDSDNDLTPDEIRWALREVNRDKRYEGQEQVGQAIVDGQSVSYETLNTLFENVNERLMDSYNEAFTVLSFVDDDGDAIDKNQYEQILQEAIDRVNDQDLVNQVAEDPSLLGIEVIQQLTNYGYRSNEVPNEVIRAKIAAHMDENESLKVQQFLQWTEEAYVDFAFAQILSNPEDDYDLKTFIEEFYGHTVYHEEEDIIISEVRKDIGAVQDSSTVTKEEVRGWIEEAHTLAEVQKLMNGSYVDRTFLSKAYDDLFVSSELTNYSGSYLERLYTDYIEDELSGQAGITLEDVRNAAREYSLYFLTKEISYTNDFDLVFSELQRFWPADLGLTLDEELKSDYQDATRYNEYENFESLLEALEEVGLSSEEDGAGLSLWTDMTHNITEGNVHLSVDFGEGNEQVKTYRVVPLSSAMIDEERSEAIDTAEPIPYGQSGFLEADVELDGTFDEVAIVYFNEIGDQLKVDSTGTLEIPVDDQEDIIENEELKFAVSHYETLVNEDSDTGYHSFEAVDITQLQQLLYPVEEATLTSYEQEVYADLQEAIVDMEALLESQQNNTDTDADETEDDVATPVGLAEWIEPSYQTEWSGNEILYYVNPPEEVTGYSVHQASEFQVIKPEDLGETPEIRDLTEPFELTTEEEQYIVYYVNGVADSFNFINNQSDIAGFVQALEDLTYENGLLNAYEADPSQKLVDLESQVNSLPEGTIALENLKKRVDSLQAQNENQALNEVLKDYYYQYVGQQHDADFYSTLEMLVKTEEAETSTVEEEAVANFINELKEILETTYPELYEEYIQKPDQKYWEEPHYFFEKYDGKVQLILSFNKLNSPIFHEYGGYAFVEQSQPLPIDEAENMDLGVTPMEYGEINYEAQLTADLKPVNIVLFDQDGSVVDVVFEDGYIDPLQQEIDKYFSIVDIAAGTTAGEEITDLVIGVEDGFTQNSEVTVDIPDTFTDNSEYLEIDAENDTILIEKENVSGDLHSYTIDLDFSYDGDVETKAVTINLESSAAPEAETDQTAGAGEEATDTSTVETEEESDVSKEDVKTSEPSEETQETEDTTTEQLN
ncbi:S-layer homology domain-containing protein [Halobacillus litoralis]|uniref:S-layer homology domain-containing protein n=1 Tax=Halobacillus litoralis TaxID=45668 RepID=UPI001CD80A75|nr:S-layer homology domain-containing protein [Halobacillus litoralis]MCA0970945.1 S-layer homology domain-containing protein [Halobacillus litoralis]